MSCLSKWKSRTECTNVKHIEWLSDNPTFDVILFGDSMFERFTNEDTANPSYVKHLSKYSIFNCSVGGDRICNMLWRLQEGKILEYIECLPSKIIILAGANDVEYKEKAIPSMIDGYKKIVEIFKNKFPSAHIDVLGVYPRKSDKIKEPILFNIIMLFNAKLQDLAYAMDVKYLYFGDDIVNVDNSIIDNCLVDNVHFSQFGYEKFATRLHSLINN